MDKGTLSTQKNVRPLVGLFQPKWKSSFVAFVKNEGVDEDNNQNLIGSKLIVTCSVSIKCDGLTIFENETFITYRVRSPLSRFSVCFEGPFSLLLRNWSKKDFFMIFFSSESWDSILFRSDIGGTAGGLGEALFYISRALKWNFLIFEILQTKIALPQVPPRSPNLHIWKVWNLSFHWKKNYPSSCFPSVFTFSWNYELKSIQNEDNGPWSKFQISQPKFHEFQ